MAQTYSHSNLHHGRRPPICFLAHLRYSRSGIDYPQRPGRCRLSTFGPRASVLVISGALSVIDGEPAVAPAPQASTPVAEAPRVPRTPCDGPVAAAFCGALRQWILGHRQW